MQQLRLGIIGMSSGNGHPYSWAAIFNGYEPSVMAACPFPVIPDYLGRRSFPADAIAGARVTHIWTQDRAISRHVAAASRISTIVDEYRDMIGDVDAILLARDDAERHEEFAAPFLAAGLPIYIDKPLALTVKTAQAIYSRQRRPGQVFSCSALAYAAEFCLSPEARAELGPLRRIEGTTPKDWDRYAVHVIEPMLLAMAGNGPVRVDGVSGTTSRHLELTWASGVTGGVTSTGEEAGPLAIRFIGDEGAITRVVADYFSAFKTALQRFVAIVRRDTDPQDAEKVYDVVRVIEAGRTPHEQ